MKKIATVFFLFSILLFACDGDCVKCHPKLLKNGKLDKNHIILGRCLNRYKVTSDDLNRMGAICGQDCWEWHSIKKVQKIKIKEHMVLDKCIVCHKKLDKSNNDFIMNNIPDQKMLKDILDGNKSL